MIKSANDQAFDFVLEDQHEFAAISGDYNPLHLDPVYARRTMFGAPVVHGINAFLTGWATISGEPRDIKRISTRFNKPVFLNESVTVRCRDNTADRLVFDLLVDRELRISATIDFSDKPPPDSSETLLEAAGKTVMQSPSEFPEGEQGKLKLHLDQNQFDKKYPALTWLPNMVKAQVLATTRLVGMITPGEDSIFSEMELSFSKPMDNQSTYLTYTNEKYDDRFRLLQIALVGQGLKGRLKAFHRPKSITQPGMAEIVSACRKMDRGDAKVLIVGGSRGLGETAAKTFAALGCDVAISYSSGEQDAKRITDEICSAGERAEYVEINISDNETITRLTNSGDQFDIVLYFATPPIFRGSKVFSESLLKEFLEYYVFGFERLVRGIHKKDRPLLVFYPSTVAITDNTPKMMEYITAKSAGEQFCRAYESNYPALSILVERLPRLPSDQTQTLMAIPFEMSTLEYMSGLAKRLLAEYIKSSRSSVGS